MEAPLGLLKNVFGQIPVAGAIGPDQHLCDAVSDGAVVGVVLNIQHRPLKLQPRPFVKSIRVLVVVPPRDLNQTDVDPRLSLQRE